jgi:integrase
VSICVYTVGVLSSKLEQFINRKGYETVRYNKRKKRWLHISEASRVTGLSRPTVYRILEEFPEKPSKVSPKYVDKLEDSAGFKRFIQMYKNKLSRDTFQQNVRYLTIGFRKLDYKDPETWIEEDYRKLWFDPEFSSEECKGIKKFIGIYFRRIMRATDNYHLLNKFKYNTPPEGKRKQWFLHTSEIKKLIREIEDLEVLVLLYVGNAVGARHSALKELKVNDIDFHDKTIQVYEKKIGDYVTKYPPHSIFDVLKLYIEDHDLKFGDKMFNHSYNWHLTKLSEAGKRAKLTKNISTHILKHTFVTQARRHRVSAEVLVDMTGTELRTLEKFYTGKDEAKIRFEMQGIDYKATPFHEWVANLSIFFEARYNELKETRPLKNERV